MYCKVDKLLGMAEKNNTAVIAFVCMDFLMARTVILAAEATKTPAIVMLYPSHVDIRKSCVKSGYAANVKELAEMVKVPIGLHMDHDFTYQGCMDSVAKGFESIMIDGSAENFEDNIKLTKQVTDEAHKKGIFVEGELGHVGLAAASDNVDEDLFTKPDVADDFCKQTNIDALAISMGNAHGKYLATPQLDMNRLTQIHKLTKTPLVLHGGSGIPDDQLLEAFSKGIRKFNLGTEFMGKYYDAITEYAEEYKNSKAPIKILEMPTYIENKLQPYVEERLKTLCHFENMEK